MEETGTGAYVKCIQPTPEKFPLLPALAERLGVKPGHGASRVSLAMSDGTSYDLFALINAFLDKIDAKD